MITPKEIDVAARYVRGKCGDAAPRVAIILGSGIPRPAVDASCEVRYADVPYLVAPTVEGHRGVFVFGRAGDVPVVLADGRLHAYEGIPADVATMPVRLCGRLGCRTLILTGAVGSLREGFAPGDVVVVRDHVNLFAPSPFAGRHHEEFGPRFVAAAAAYDAGLAARAVQAAAAPGLELKEAVYAAVPGPQYETAAEVRALAALGGDVVGMSIPNETLVARQAGMVVLALCAVTNFAGEAAASHESVLAGSAAPGAAIKALVDALLPTIAAA
jgi:inosine/guanosine/xanthosine phosphorylase family protein